MHAAHPLVCHCVLANSSKRTTVSSFRLLAHPPWYRLHNTPNHTQTPTHKHDKIRMKSPRHPAMQAAEPFSDPAGTHCAGATDGANVGDDASLHHRAVRSLNGPLWLGQLTCHARHEHAHMHAL